MYARSSPHHMPSNFRLRVTSSVNCLRVDVGMPCGSGTSFHCTGSAVPSCVNTERSGWSGDHIASSSPPSRRVWSPLGSVAGVKR